MENQQRRRKQRRAALMASPTKPKARRPRSGSDHARERNELPPQTRRMLSLGVDRASMAQGGRP